MNPSQLLENHRKARLNAAKLNFTKKQKEAMLNGGKGCPPHVPGTAYVYGIVLNGVVMYVGSTVELRPRLVAHLYSYRKDIPELFKQGATLDVLEVCERSLVLKLEKATIAKYRAINQCALNISNGTELIIKRRLGRAIIDTTTGVEYASMAEAARELGMLAVVFQRRLDSGELRFKNPKQAVRLL